MNSQGHWTPACVVIATALIALPCSLSAQDFSALDPAAGKALFERNWVPAPASTAASDGLGPYYNARSCEACHPKGGAGAIDINRMSLLTRDAVYGEMLQLRAVTGLPAETSAGLDYKVHANVELKHARVELLEPELGLSIESLATKTSLRRAPALHGLALLDAVPRAQLEALADPDDRNGDGISGEIPPGRFGWDARTATLREQVARALSLDLGLSTSVFPDAAGDCTAQQQACIAAAKVQTGDALEAPDLVLDLLLAYLKSLPEPQAPVPEGAGFELFSTLGCANCHVPQLDAGGHGINPYTDLLLHDMGPGLSSAGAANWRTAPLWGLRADARFLHDGRARNIDEAVLWHGGEAAASVAAYRELNTAQRDVLQAWLLGL